MPTQPTAQLSVTWEQVAAFRLARHHLLERAPLGSLLAVAGDMTGAQAQLLSAAQISLWARVKDLQIADIETAMRERTLVKAGCMRRTLFLVPSDQLAVFVRGSARRAEKDIRWTLGKGVPERVVAAAIEAALAALEQPLTRPEIAERVSRALGVQMQAIQGGTGWGSRKQVEAVPLGDIHFPVVYLLHLVAARGVFCYGPSRGNEPTFVRADAWIPNWRDVPVEEAEDRLLRLYLRAYGPSTPADFALWSGMTLTEARAIWARGQPAFAPVDVAGWAGVVLNEDLPALARASFARGDLARGDLAQDAFAQPSVRLLPYFDTFLLGHRERDHLVGAEQRASVYRPQGWIAPVILTNGRAAATWEYAREGDRLRVKVMPFAPLPEGVRRGIEDEAHSLADFLSSGFHKNVPNLRSSISVV